MSIRFKILLILIFLTGITSGLFLIFARKTFENDKKAYVYDSALSLSRNLISRAESELDTSISIVQSLIQGYDVNTKIFHEVSEGLFESSQIVAIQVWTKEQQKDWTLSSELSKVGTTKDWKTEIAGWDKLLPGTSQIKVVDQQYDKTTNRLLGIAFAMRFGTDNPQSYIICAYLPIRIFERIFGNMGGTQAVLFLSDSEKIVADSHQLGTKANNPNAVNTEELIQHIASQSSRIEEVKELALTGGKKHLLGFVPSQKYQLAVVSTLPVAVAMSAVQVLEKQTGLLFVIVVLFSILIGVIASKSITGALTTLTHATTKIVHGDYDLNLRVSGTDEIATLANGFQKMSHEIGRLMRETAEKTRMQTELSTAKTVQDMLFPEPSQSLGSVRVSGRYISASECGGDWWYYWDAGDRVYIWVADATGHGVPAALVTSASCAAVAVIKHFQEGSILQMAQAMNYAIGETSHGERMMTMFLLQIDKTTGMVEYVNCSHLPAIVFEAPVNTELRWSDIPMLAEPISPRLGEKLGGEFAVGQHQLKPGDRVMLITDGVFDITNKAGKELGERRFLTKVLQWLQSAPLTTTPDDIVGNAMKIASDFGEGQIPPDDITVVVFDFQPALAFSELSKPSTTR